MCPDNRKRRLRKTDWAVIGDKFLLGLAFAVIFAVIWRELCNYLAST